MNGVKKNIVRLLPVLILFLVTQVIFAVAVPISTFPLDNYNQNVDAWLKPSNFVYNVPLISPVMQKQRLQEYYDHLFATTGESQSPWNPTYINEIFAQTPDIKTLEQGLIDAFSNKRKEADKIGYGENFRPHTQQWIANIATNMNLNQFNSLTYQSGNRAIAVANLHARVLPTNDVHFFKFTLPGQGFPFDNLQMSSLWAGTPVYIIARSKDLAWDFVLTPSLLAWVPSAGIALTDDNFVTSWQTAAKKCLAAITHTKTVVNSNERFRFYGYVGAVFPAYPANDGAIAIIIPVKKKNGYAEIQYSPVSVADISIMPLMATPHNFANIIKTLINRPYGWGGMYFYNDCSAELKSLYAPFGIWLPRHSSDQVTAGKMVDKSSADMQQRLQYLLQNGHRLMTIVYVGGHIIMYLGKYGSTAMTYQDLWGLRPADGSRRAVIGESLLFPLLKEYPEDPTLNSLANNKNFQVAFLDEWTPLKEGAKRPINLTGLVYPGFMLK
jgi:cell wall-associated NlpC family hydrolase